MRTVGSSIPHVAHVQQTEHPLSGQADCLIEDPATGLHRPRDYMQSLESRVAYLERLLKEARPDLAADHMDHSLQQAGTDGDIQYSHIASPVHMLVSPPLQSDVLDTQSVDMQRAQTGRVRSSEGPEFLPVSSEVGLLCVNASGREPQYLGHSSALSFAQIATNTMGLQSESGGQGPGWAHTAVLDRHRRKNKTSKLEHPTTEMSEILSKAYFENIHSQYPFLHQPTFASWERKCREANESGTLLEVEHVPLFFVTMVYAIGSIVLSHELSSDAEDLYGMAMQYSSSILNTDTLESVQALIACAVFSIRSPVGASLWMISGMALRKSIGLGYHRSFHRFKRPSGILSQEMAKRCFWCSYDIDRVTSFVLGRPSAISDQAIDVEVCPALTSRSIINVWKGMSADLWHLSYHSTLMMTSLRIINSRNISETTQASLRPR